MASEFVVTVLYPAGGTFDMRYYKSSPLPLVSRLLSPLGMRQAAYIRPIEDDADAPYQLIAELRFDSREAGLAALAMHGQETQDDIANFTDVTPIIVTGDLKSG